MSSKWVNQIVDCVFGNDKLCCFCPRPESTFWTMTQNASTQNLKFPILLFHINKVGARINQMGHHFNKMGARINKMGHSESTKCGAPTICRSYEVEKLRGGLSKNLRAIVAKEPKLRGCKVSERAVKKIEGRNCEVAKLRSCREGCQKI